MDSSRFPTCSHFWRTAENAVHGILINVDSNNMNYRIKKFPWQKQSCSLIRPNQCMNDNMRA